MSDLVDRFIKTYGRLPTEFDPDYLEMLRMSKYRILDVPDLAPAKCSNCGSCKNDGRGYIDFGLHVDWYGVVYLCGNCLHDIAKQMGLFNDLLEKLKRLEEEKTEISGLQEQGVQLHDTVVRTFSDLKDFYVGVYSHRTDNDPDIPTSVEPEQTSEVKSGSDEAESGTTKQTTVTRRKNVRSLTDLLNE